MLQMRAGIVNSEFRHLTLQFIKPREMYAAVEGQLATLNADTLGGKVAITFGQVMDRYIAEELPTLKLSTQETNLGMIENHLRPRWGDEPLEIVTALQVRGWLVTLPVGASRKANARGAISRLLDLAMLWEYMPVVRNPMNLVKVKGSSKRVKSVTLLTPAMLKTIIKGLAAPYSLIVLVCGCLGLRISETLALKWEDFDWKGKQVLIRRAFTHGNIQESTKTDSSEADLPVFDLLAKSLHAWRESAESAIGMGISFSIHWRTYERVYHVVEAPETCRRKGRDRKCRIP